MLKICFALSSLCIFSFPATLRPQSVIESLQTDSEVTAFVQGLDSAYSSFHLAQIEYVYDTASGRTGAPEGLKAWALCDLDNNGRTDLLAWGGYYSKQILVILDRGKKTYEISDLPCTREAGYCFPLLRDNRLWMYPCDTIPGEPGELVYRFGGLVEAAKGSPVKHKLEAIHLNTDFCMGMCHVFRISLFDTRRVVYTAEANAVVPPGTYTTRIPKTQWKEICNLLNYMQFSTMKGNYEVGWTCDQTYTLHMLYNEGEKHIRDYGGRGTAGLMLLYKKLDYIIATARWKKLK